MQIDSIDSGIVIDHIRAGFGLKVVDYLNIDTDNQTVAVIMNAASKKLGRKDIVKLENVTDLDIDVKALGLIAPGATVSVIQNHQKISKTHHDLPKRVKNIVKCKNPRCVTSIEAVPHIFHKVNDSGMYRCEYCDHILRPNEL